MWPYVTAMHSPMRNLSIADNSAGKEACKDIEEQEEESLYHGKGWCRELWIASLGMPTEGPPPEEEKAVKTAIVDPVAQ